MAKALVGLEGRGEATIFGGTTNPIAIYAQTQAARQRRQAEQAQLREKQVNETLDYIDKIGSTTKFDEYNVELAMNANNFSGYSRQALRDGKPVNILMGEAANFKRDQDALAQEMNAAKGIIDKTDKEISDLQTKGIYWSGDDNPEGTNAAWEVRKLYRNPDGTLKPFSEARGYVNKIDKYKNDARLINPQGATKNWINGIEEQARHYMDQRKGAIGYNDDTIENTVKSRLQYEMDGINLKFDENNLPIPIVNDFTLGLAMQNRHMRSLINANGGTTNESKKQYLKSLITPGQDITDYGDKKVTLGRALKEPKGDSRFSIAIGSGGSKYADNALDVFDRVEAAIKPGANKPENLSSISDAYRGVSMFYSDETGQKVNDGKTAKYVTAMVPDKNKISQQMTLIMAVPPADPDNEESVKQRQEAIKQIINDNPTTFEKVIVDRNDNTALADFHSRVADIYSALDVGSTDKRGLFRSDYHKILEKKYNVKTPKLPQGKVR